MPATSEQRLHEVLLNLAKTLVTGFDIGDILDTLCDNVVELLPVTGAGVMLLEPLDRSGDGDGHKPGQLRTVAASDARIHVIERLQIELDEGPCLEAWRTGEQVVAGDLAASEQRWPRFAPAAVLLEMKSVHSFPLRFEGTPLGALNLFNVAPVEFTGGDCALAQLLGDIATAYVINTRAHDRQVALTAQLQHALDSRVVIEQAKGKLSAQLDVDVDAAFERMRSFARGRGLRLREVARAVVEGSLDITTGQGAPVPVGQHGDGHAPIAVIPVEGFPTTDGHDPAGLAGVRHGTADGDGYGRRGTADGDGHGRHGTADGQPDAAGGRPGELEGAG